MPSNKEPNLEKIFRELDKIDDENILYASLATIKEFVTKKLIARQKELDDKSSDLASKISKINGD